MSPKAPILGAIVPDLYTKPEHLKFIADMRKINREIIDYEIKGEKVPAVRAIGWDGADTTAVIAATTVPLALDPAVPGILLYVK